MQGDVHVGQTIIGEYHNLRWSHMADNLMFHANKSNAICADFIPGAIFRTLAKEAEKLGNGAFPVMITPHNDGKNELTYMQS